MGVAYSCPSAVAGAKTTATLTSSGIDLTIKSDNAEARRRIVALAGLQSAQRDPLRFFLVGVERIVLGSVSEHVVREAGCTVEVARPKTYDHVELLDVKTVEPTHHHYVPPHRYTYDQHCATMRPDEWPLY